jgi:regulator of sigma E protease
MPRRAAWRATSFPQPEGPDLDPISLIPSFGGFFWTVAAFVIALSIIVAIHEFGHYIVGRWSGIHAEVFSLGFGPRLWSRVDKRGTRWQIAALPLGGYVKFLGDANAASAGVDVETMAQLTPEERRHTMHGAPLWARAATVAAGPLFNFLLSILVFAGLFMVSGAPADRPVVGQIYELPGGPGGLRPGDEILGVEGIETPTWDMLAEAADKLPAKAALDYRIRRGTEELTVPGPFAFPPRAASVVSGSAAMDAGLRKGDVIEAADGDPVVRFADLQAKVKAVEGAPILLTVWRAGETIEVTLAPRETDQPITGGGFETSYKIGIVGDFFFTPTTRQVGPAEAVGAAARQTWSIVSTSVSAIGHIVTGAISSCNLRGPIGIAETSGQAASQGLGDFVWFIAVLSTAVGFLNLFPIPMLDGGHLVFYTYEWATGRPLPERALNIATTVGLFLVLALMVFGLTNDLFCP